MNYITTPEFINYAAQRGVVFTTEAAEVLLTKAADFLALVPWVGEKTDPAQALDWPRTGVKGYDDKTIPQAVVDAQCRLAMVAKQMDLLPSFKGGAQLTEKTLQGVGTFKYAENTFSTLPSFPWFMKLLAGLIDTNEIGAVNFRVRRG